MTGAVALAIVCLTLVVAAGDLDREHASALKGLLWGIGVGGALGVAIGIAINL